MQPAGYKITMDEPVLAATALQMHHEKEVMTAARGYEINGCFVLLGGYVDKRPYFFPFLLSVLHDLSGYRPLQGVALNALLTPVFLGLLFLAGRLLWRGWGGYLAVGLFATVPLLAMNATGAGFDLLNLVMILATGLAAVTYLRRPDAARLNTLVLLGLLLAQTRYESVLYVLAVGVVALAGWWSLRRIELSWTAVLAPVLLITFPLQQIIFNDYPDLWQLDEGVHAPFSPSFIPGNIGHALNFFFSVDWMQPSSLLLSVLFCAALLVFPVLLAARRARVRLAGEGAAVPLSFSAIILCNLVLLMSYHWGQVDDVIATRIILPFILLQVFFVVWVAGRLPGARVTPGVLAAAVVLFFIGVTRPVSARSDFLVWGHQRDACDWARAQALRFRDRSPLFVTNQTIVITAEQVSSIPIRLALRRKDQLALHQDWRSFSDILFVHSVDTDPTDGMDFNAHEVVAAHFETETLEEAFLMDGLYMRLSRLVRVIPEGEDRAAGDRERAARESSRDERLKIFSATLP
jgi:hypothetical protein